MDKLGFPQWNLCFCCQVTEDIAIVGTLDFFTPIVDEPEATRALVSWVKTGCNELYLILIFLRSDPNRSKQENKNSIDIHPDTGMLWSGMMPCDNCRNGCVSQEVLQTGAPVITNCSTPWIDKKDKHHILWKASYHYDIASRKGSIIKRHLWNACSTFFAKVFCLVIHVDVWWYCLFKVLADPH